MNYCMNQIHNLPSSGPRTLDNRTAAATLRTYRTIDKFHTDTKKKQKTTPLHHRTVADYKEFLNLQHPEAHSGDGVKDIPPNTVWDDLFSFAVVRDPYARQVSLFHYNLDKCLKKNHETEEGFCADRHMGNPELIKEIAANHSALLEVRRPFYAPVPPAVPPPPRPPLGQA